MDGLDSSRFRPTQLPDAGRYHVNCLFYALLVISGKLPLIYPHGKV
jgi:hypothetical protein